jgi:uncharacterized protein (DUF58 family)
MIVPRTRLIVITALVLLPAGVMAAWHPGTTPAAWFVVAVYAAACIMDAVNSRRRLDGWRMSTPAVIRLTVDRSGSVPLVIHVPAAGVDSIRVGLALPAGIVAESREMTIPLQAEQPACMIQWACRAGQRGRYDLTGCHAQIPSYWGLWSMQRRFALQSEIRVYPNLVGGQQDLGGLFQRRELGLRTQRRIGKGREFEQLRDYCPGDSYEDIDWKATARRRYPVTRVYQVEQSQELYIVLDASRLSTRNAGFIMDRRRLSRPDGGASRTSIFERYITAALVMGIAASKAADRYGLLIFSDRPDCFIKAGRGQAHFNACREALYNRMPSLASPDFEELFAFVGTRLRKRALLVFLTSLDDPVLSENFLQAMTPAAKKHILLINMLRPPGAHPLFHSDKIRAPDGIYQHLVGHMLWNNLAETRRKLRRHRAGFQLLDNEALCGQLVRQYMDIKQRQIL